MNNEQLKQNNFHVMTAIEVLLYFSSEGCSNKDYLGEVDYHLFLEPQPKEKNFLKPITKFQYFEIPNQQKRIIAFHPSKINFTRILYTL